jgi:hypothetical protein
MSEVADGPARDGDEVVEFGWETPKPLSGRRKKAHNEAKKKNKPGTFGEALQRRFDAHVLWPCPGCAEI